MKLEGSIVPPVEEHFAERVQPAAQLASRMESNAFVSKALAGREEDGNFVGRETTYSASFQSNLWAKKDAPFGVVSMRTMPRACARVRRVKGAAVGVLELGGHQQLGGV